MIFNQNHLESFKKQLQRHYKSDDNWLKLLIRSFNDYETFSEYWAFMGNEKAKNDLKYFIKIMGHLMRDFLMMEQVYFLIN